MNQPLQKSVAAILVTVIVSGCAANAENFYRQRQTMSDVQLCRTYESSEQKTFQAQSVNNEIFANDVRVELNSRNLSADQYKKIVTGQNVAIGAGAILGAALIAIARRNGGGGGGNAYRDTDWDWDEFYDGSHRLVWACRGVQTGQFADSYHCAGKPQTDERWPGK